MILKEQYLLHMASQYDELRPTSGWDRLANLGHPCKFQLVSRLRFVTAPMSLNGGQPNFARCLAVSWVGTSYIFLGLLPSNRIVPGAKFILHPSLAFYYFGSVTARHSSSGCQPILRRGSVNGITELSLLVNFNSGRHLYIARAAITLGIGPHSSNILKWPELSAWLTSWKMWLILPN